MGSSSTPRTVAALTPSHAASPLSPLRTSDSDDDEWADIVEEQLGGGRDADGDRTPTTVATGDPVRGPPSLSHIHFAHTDTPTACPPLFFCAAQTGDLPFHRQYRKRHGQPIPRPLCSKQGIQSWIKPHNGLGNVVRLVRSSAGRVSDVMHTAQTVVDTGQTVQVELTRGTVLAIEADCNLGKSYAVLNCLLRPLLAQDPRTPLLFWSVRITHAYDLHATLQREFEDIPGVDIRCYKDHGTAGSQLVCSAETAAFGRLDTERFTDGVVVFDEYASLALSHGSETNGTIKDPAALVRVMRKIVRAAKFVVVMDRDLTLTPLASRHLALIAPRHDVLHVQFDTLGQPGSRFCYTADHKKHEKCGRGARLAWDRLLLHVDTCMRSFESADPQEWRRLLIGVASKRRGETVCEKLRLWGVRGEHIRFYHGEIGDTASGPVASRSDLRDTTTAWRDVQFIVTTSTITVAINPKLNFLARWLFTHQASGLQYVASEACQLMQLIARIPRGTPEEQRAQLDDPRIFTLFEGDYPALFAPEEVSRESVRGVKRALDDTGLEVHEEQRLGGAIRQERGESVAGAHCTIDGALQTLRATVRRYRETHVGKQHVYRFFEIGAKCGFEEPEEMAPLSGEERETIERFPGRVVEELRDCAKMTELTPANHERRFEILTTLHAREADESGTTLQEVRREFLQGGACAGEDVVSKLKRDVYFTLRPFDCELEMDKADYAWLHKHRTALERLAKFRHWTLEDVRAADHTNIERSERLAETVEHEGPLCAKFHELAALIGVELRDLLSHEFTFDTSARWVAVHNRLNEQTEADVQLRAQIKSLIGEMRGVDKRQWAQVSHLGKLIDRAVRTVGLSLCTEPPMKVGVRIESASVVEEMRDEVSFADKVRLYSSELKQFVPASKYREQLERHRLEVRLEREDFAAPRSPVPTFRQPVSNAYTERYDANSLRRVLDQLSSTEPQRAQELEDVMRRLVVEETPQLREKRRALLREVDKLEFARALSTMSESDGWIEQTVRYEQENALGRQRARAQRTVSVRAPDDDDLEIKRPKERAVCYQGMPPDLRPVLGGAFLHDVRIDDCTATLIANYARRKKCSEAEVCSRALEDDAARLATERARLESDDDQLWKIWLQTEENELLKLIVQRLRDRDWRVVALVARGVLVEDCGVALEGALRDVEVWLGSHHWSAVHLVEAPLFGAQPQNTG